MDIELLAGGDDSAMDGGLMSGGGGGGGAGRRIGSSPTPSGRKRHSRPAGGGAGCAADRETSSAARSGTPQVFTSLTARESTAAGPAAALSLVSSLWPLCESMATRSYTQGPITIHQLALCLCALAEKVTTWRAPPARLSLCSHTLSEAIGCFILVAEEGPAQEWRHQSASALTCDDMVVC